jgi:hypothetical protein
MNVALIVKTSEREYCWFLARPLLLLAASYIEMAYGTA